MKTKKLVAGIVAAMTLTSLASSLIVTAADDDFGVEISNATAEAGESFQLTLDMSNIPSTGLNGCDFAISYDSSLVSIDEVTLGSLTKDVSSVEPGLPAPFECNIETDNISIMYALGTTDTTYYLTGSDTFLNITGTVNDDALAGDKADFKIVPVDRAEAPESEVTNSSVIFGYMDADEATTIYTPTLTDGYVEIKSEQTGTTDYIPDGTNYGDVNDSGGIPNIADVVDLNMHLISVDNLLSETGKANADCVRDHKITAADSALILNYITMLIDISELGKV